MPFKGRGFNVTRPGLLTHHAPITFRSRAGEGLQTSRRGPSYWHPWLIGVHPTPKVPTHQKPYFPEKHGPLGIPHPPPYFSLHPDSLTHLSDLTRRKKNWWFFLIWHLSNKSMILHDFWVFEELQASRCWIHYLRIIRINMVQFSLKSDRIWI